MNLIFFKSFVQVAKLILCIEWFIRVHGRRLQLLRYQRLLSHRSATNVIKSSGRGWKQEKFQSDSFSAWVLCLSLGFIVHKKTTESEKKHLPWSSSSYVSHTRRFKRRRKPIRSKTNKNRVKVWWSREGHWSAHTTNPTPFAIGGSRIRHTRSKKSLGKGTFTHRQSHQPVSSWIDKIASRRVEQHRISPLPIISFKY